MPQRIFAIAREREPGEHLSLADLRHPAQHTPDARCQILVIRHGGIVAL